MGEQRRKGHASEGGDSSTLHDAPPLQGWHSLPMSTAQSLAVPVCPVNVPTPRLCLGFRGVKAMPCRAGGGTQQSECGKQHAISTLCFLIPRLTSLCRWQRAADRQVKGGDKVPSSFQLCITARVMVAAQRTNQCPTQLFDLSLYALCRLSNSSLSTLIVPRWSKGESEPVMLAWWCKGELQPLFLP